MLISAQFAQETKLHEMAQEAAPKEIANGRLRRLSALNQSIEGADVTVANLEISHESASRKSAPRWRGPAAISDIDEAWVTAEFQGQTFKVARFCARRQYEPKDVGGVECTPASESIDALEGLPPSMLGKRGDDERLPQDGLRKASETSTGSPNQETGKENGSEPSSPAPVAIPAPSFFSLAIQLPSSPSVSVELPLASSSFDEDCSQLHEPEVTQGDYGQLTCDGPHELRWGRGYDRNDSEAVLKTCLAERKRYGYLRRYACDTGKASPH